jgi:hypothetical protein
VVTRGISNTGFDSRLGPTYDSRPMGIRVGAKWAIAAGLLLLPIMSEAHAQSAGGDQATTDKKTDAKVEGESKVRAERSDALRGDAPSLRLGDVDASKVSKGEKQSRADKMLGDQRAALQRGSDLLNEARGAKDIVQLNCVNEKLTQIKGLLKLSEQASTAMYDSMAATNGGEQVNHEFTKIVVAHGRSQQLRAEAEQCVGERSVYTGDTEVDVEIDEDIPANDPTLPIAPPPGPTTSPVASGIGGG